MLAYVKDSKNTVSVAGFRIGKSLSWGQFLYVDDLVTIQGHRSRDYGSALLKWLTVYAEKKGSYISILEFREKMHIDSTSEKKWK